MLYVCRIFGKPRGKKQGEAVSLQKRTAFWDFPFALPGAAVPCLVIAFIFA